MSLDDYYRHNLLGRKNPSEGRIDGDSWWTGKFQFQSHHPQRRFVKGPNGPVELIRYWEPYHAAGRHEHTFSDNTTVKYDLIYVPDIGIFSRFDGDCVEEGEELHERMKYIMLMQARSFAMEEPERWTGQQLIMQKSWERTDRVHVLREELVKYYSRWKSYSNMFKLGWGDLPAMYLEHFDRATGDKIAQFNSPEALAKRARAKARKLATEVILGK